MVNHYIPSSLKEALELVNKHDCYIMMGGTDLMVQKHRSKGLLPTFDKDVIYLVNLDELNYEYIDKKGNYHIGAATKYIQLENSDLCPQILKDIIHEIASPNIRHMATLVGNIANASPAGDSLVGLYLLNAQVVLTSVNGSRVVPIEKFILGARRIDRLSNEIITEVIIPKFNEKYLWKKVGSRRAESISKLSFLGSYKVKKGHLVDLRLAFGSVSTTVIRNREIENSYLNAQVPLSVEIIDGILAKYDSLIKPITDQRSTKDYRKQVAINIAKYFLQIIK